MPGKTAPRPDSADAEILDRLRRIETKFTRYVLDRGGEIPGEKPTFSNGKLDLPTPACAIRDCLAAIPEGWDQPVEMFVGGEYLTTLTL